jgi:hypothetical protein
VHHTRREAPTCVYSKTMILMHGASAQTNPFERIYLASQYTEIPASEIYPKDSSKNAEKMASDEKETKKKSSMSRELFGRHLWSGLTNLKTILRLKNIS